MSNAEREEYMRAKNLIKIPIVMGKTRKKLKETKQIEMAKMFCLVSLAVFVVSKTGDFSILSDLAKNNRNRKGRAIR